MYEVRVTVKDGLNNEASRTATIYVPSYTLYFPNGGQNVSIGKVGVRDKAVEMPADWNIWQGDNKLNFSAMKSYGGTIKLDSAGDLQRVNYPDADFSSIPYIVATVSRTELQAISGAPVTRVCGKTKTYAFVGLKGVDPPWNDLCDVDWIAFGY
jgi:hypothetical protein